MRMKHPVQESIELGQLNQLNDDEQEDEWVDINRNAVFYRRIINRQ